MAVRLYFPDPESLWQFLAFLCNTTTITEIDANTLVAAVEAAEIELAINGFGATVEQQSSPVNTGDVIRSSIDVGNVFLRKLS